MAWARIQGASAAADAATVAATFTANLTAGTKLIAVVGKNSGASNVTSVKDGAGNSFTLLGTGGTASATCVTMWALDTPAGDVGTKPTITATGVLSGLGILILEVSGLLAGNTTAMLDGTPKTLAGTAASTGTPASYASTAANEFLVTAYGDLGSGVTPTAAVGWTRDAASKVASTSANAVLQYKNSTGTTETDGFTTADTGGWALILVAFKLAAGGVNGTASVPVTATVSAAGSVTKLGQASVPVTATVSAAGSVTFLGQASVPVTATVSADGLAGSVLSGDVSLAWTAAVSTWGSVPFAATAIRVYPRTYSWAYRQVSQGAAVAATAAVSAAGSVTFLGSASRPVTATVSAAGSVTFVGTASRAVSATVSAAGSVTFLGGASRPVTATVSAGGSLVLLGQASVPVTATVSAAGSVIPAVSGGASVAVSAVVALTGAVGTGGLAVLGWSVTVSAAGSLALPGGASVPVAASVAAAGSVTFLGQASRPVTAAVAAAGSVGFVGSASRTVTAVISAGGSVIPAFGGSASVAVQAAVSAAGFIVAPGDVSLEIVAAVAATGYASGGASVISGGAMPWTFFADSAVAPFADIGPVQVVAFTADWQLSGFGSGEATIAIGPQSALPRSMLMQLWTWRLWAFYQGVPVWAGSPTGVVDQGNQTVTVALSELPGYLSLKQYALNHTYTGVEQCTIAADLASPLSNIGVAVTRQPGPGVNRDRTYTFLQNDRGQMLTELSQVINGPEFRSEYAVGAGGAGCTLRLAYPRVGAAGNLAVVVPHGAISFRTTWAGDMMRTRTFAVGDLPPNAPTTQTRPVVTIVAPQTGVPELDRVDDWPGVVLTSTLNEHASAYSQSYAQPALSLEVVMPLMAPLLGTYLVGDDVAVSLADPLVPSGLNATGRLTALRLDAGSGTVTWTVAITLPHPRKYASLSAQLKTLHRKTAGIFHNSLAAPPGGINP